MQAEAILRKGKAGPTFGRHPWVFSGAIESFKGDPTDGQPVRILSDQGRFLGWGVYNSKSQIRVRVYGWNESEEISEALISRLLKEAIDYRIHILGLKDPRGCYRLVFSEGDGLSGLIVDYYAGYLVIQLTSLALQKYLDLVVRLLSEWIRPKGVYLRCDQEFSKQEGIAERDRVLCGEIPESKIEIIENDVRYLVDLKHGQKTGFFADQRDNRKLAARLAFKKTVLDLCSYTGGFALQAAYAGATHVLGVDSSSEAIQGALENVGLNHLRNVKFKRADVLEWLHKDSTQYDLVILDPPRLARKRSDRSRAFQTYFKYNMEALKKVASGGFFVTCSCSQQMSLSDFQSLIASVIRRSGRTARLYFLGGQAPDHLQSTSCLETSYLKALFLHVR